MRAGAAQEGVVFPVPSRHIELANHVDETALVAKSRQPVLLVKYLEIHLTDVEIWLRFRRIKVNVGMSSAVS